MVISVPGTALVAPEVPAVSFSGEHRARFESLDPPQYRPGFPPSDQSLSLRTGLRLDAAWPRAQLVLELVDSRAEQTVNDAPRSTSLVNTLEFIQAAVSWGITPAAADYESRITAALLTKNLGMRRLIARSRFRNTANAFAGVDWDWQSVAGQRINAFYLHPMRRLPDDDNGLSRNRHKPDDISRDTVLAGIYWQIPLQFDATIAELLVLRSDGPDTRSPGTSRHDLETVSVRVTRAAIPRQWDFEAEAITQRGWSSADDDSRMLRHRAQFLHLEAGYTFGSACGLRLAVQYDNASGDRNRFDDRAERFDTLYGARSFELGPSAIYGPFVRGNLKALGLRLTLRPYERMSMAVAYRGNWLASAADAWAAAGFRDEAGRSGDAIGRQLQASVNWAAIPSRLMLDFGITHLRYGQFPRTAPSATARSRSTYTYTAITLRFGDYRIAEASIVSRLEIQSRQCDRERQPKYDL